MQHTQNVQMGSSLIWQPPPDLEGWPLTLPDPVNVSNPTKGGGSRPEHLFFLPSAPNYAKDSF